MNYLDSLLLSQAFLECALLLHDIFETFGAAADQPSLGSLLRINEDVFGALLDVV